MSFCNSLRQSIISHLKATQCSVTAIDKTCGQFLRIEVTSARFMGASILEQHRMVTDVIAASGMQLHGFTIVTKTP